MPDSAYVVSVDRLLDAPPERVFALLIDPEQQVRLDGSGTVKAVKQSRTPLRVGSTFDMHMKRGFAYSTRNTVTELEPDRLITWSTRPLTFPLSLLIGGRTWSYRLDPEGGATRVTETWDLRGEKNRALVAKAAGDPGKDMAATLERLADVLA
ncbi:hypothetical protein GCM10011519_30780 [Marmoricola endophyticus]|uniref:Dimethyladenosine transferase n=1 Tax=Marmoricola endophyticus TaxID=2040280 RepID=A0A917BSV8_9ACTN|nr:SRPBCC family protein [Marmoricola endophyticus]GGF54719.1 hypothetical protein GCM10011519_30780 [Marmoricola endophyticus]